MQIFVTGGSGMIGSHSVERLVADGHEVHALTRNEAGAELLESFLAAGGEGRAT